MVIMESVCDCGGRGVEASSARGFHLRERERKKSDCVSEQKLCLGFRSLAYFILSLICFFFFFFLLFIEL